MHTALLKPFSNVVGETEISITESVQTPHDSKRDPKKDRKEAVLPLLRLLWMWARVPCFFLGNLFLFTKHNLKKKYLAAKQACSSLM